MVPPDQAGPAMTAVLLILGFAGGVGTTYKMMEAKRPATQAAL